MHPHAPPQRTALCPVRAQSPAPGLILSLTLPGDPRSAAVGRHAVAASLPTYGLHAFAWPVTLAVTELIAVNAALTPGRELYLSLRHRDDALRLVLWDQHPHHADADTLALCEARRRGALWLLAAVIDDWGGKWGVAEVSPPQRGTKSWVVLPR
ncbi:ATP-binding protein [Streptomyces sp. NPDC051064]|uniref:ATP-binding protein n=1 Tax=Streptomyces sp. NPDC051064 TaxID=3365641 RepID=UPI0037B0C155